jgi:aquaporin related protein
MLEMFLTFGLVMTVLMVAVDKNRSTPFAPLAIGLALFSTQLAGIQYTGAAVNTGMNAYLP